MSTRTLPARLRIDEEQLAERGQLLLARVADLDGDDLVATAEGQERPAPVAGAAEVGDDDDVGLLPCEVADALQCLSDRRRAGARGAARRLVLLAQREEQAEQTCPSLPRRQCLRLLVAERDEAEAVAAPGRGVADASAAPSATSALRRSAVPKVIDGEVSSTSQVTSARSARWIRTCGVPVRAVTFQSIWRTSSSTGS